MWKDKHKQTKVCTNGMSVTLSLWVSKQTCWFFASFLNAPMHTIMILSLLELLIKSTEHSAFACNDWKQWAG